MHMRRPGVFYCLCYTVAIFCLTYGGIYKETLNLLDTNLFDLTLVATITLIFLMAFGESIIITRDAFRVSLVLLFFTIIYAGSLVYSPSDIYGPRKLLIFAGCLFSFFVGMVIPKKVERYVYIALPYFAIVSVAGYLYLMSQDFTPAKLLAFTGVSLSAGEIVGLGIVVLLCDKNRSVGRTILLVVSVIALLLLGARGPLIAALVIAIFIYGTSFFKKNADFLQNKKSNKYLYILLALLMVIVLDMDSTITIFQTLEDGLSRFSMLFESDKGNSVNSRLTMLTDSWEKIGKAPILGYGLGSYGLVVYGTDFRAYPHNVPLEIWFEGGIFCLAAFLAFVSMIFVKAATADRVLIFILAYLVFNFLKSSSLDELRMFFFACGLCVNARLIDRAVYD
jgi:O-antigen ligase